MTQGSLETGALLVADADGGPDAAAPDEAARGAHALVRLHELSARLLHVPALEGALNEVLGAAIELLSADYGNIQLFDPATATLGIVAHSGFDAAYLRHFQSVTADDASCCAQALRQRRRVAIADIEQEVPPGSYRTASRLAGYRGVQATPLISGSGALLGILSTHFREPRRPSEAELRILDLYARQAADFIERVQAAERLRLSERRHRFLVRLTEATMKLTEADEIMAVTARMLGQQLRVDRCAYAEVEADEDHFVITGNYGPQVPSIVGRWRMSAFSEEARRAMRANETWVVRDSDSDPRTAHSLDAYRATQMRAVICVPLHKNGRFDACIAVHQTVPRPWTAEEIELVELVGARCWDVIERAKAVRRLAESEARFREMADTAPVLIWMSGSDGAATWFNRPWLAFVGRSMQAALDEGRGSLHPDDAAENQRLYREAFAARRPFSLEYRLRRHDGVYRWLLDKGVPRYGRGGEFVGYIGSCIDITERKEVEAALARRAIEQTALYRFTDRLQHAGSPQDIYAAALEAIGAALGCERASILIRDEGGVMRFVAWQGLSERYRHAVEGHTPWQADEPDPQPLCIADAAPAGLPDALQRVVAEEGIAALGFFPVLADGRLIGKFMVYYGAPHPFREEERALATTIARQLGFALGRRREEEQRQRAERQLLEADRRKDEFLATLAHELRNPLAPIRNSLEIIRRAADPAMSQKAQQTIERQAAHLVRLVDDLLDISRISQNKLELRRERVALAAVVASAVETSAPILEANRQRLQLRLPDETLQLDGDPMRLAQVLANLLNNAAKYSEPGSEIGLEAALEGDELVLRVRDTGIGIEPELLPRVFEMFVQGGRTPDHAGAGLGVGLTLVQRLVELHGGRVEAHSDGRGRGSEFVVRLPAIRPREAAAGASPAAPTAEPPSARRRILVADDNSDSADSLAELLKLLGHDVVTAYDGRAAVSQAERFRPDIAVLDLGMPVMSGYDAAAGIRSRCGEGITLIALTGWGQDQDRRRTREAGFDHHLVKPVDVSALQDLLSAVR